jgi:hypothetical protein
VWRWVHTDQGTVAEAPPLAAFCPGKNGGTKSDQVEYSSNYHAQRDALSVMPEECGDVDISVSSFHRVDLPRSPKRLLDESGPFAEPRRAPTPPPPEVEKAAGPWSQIVEAAAAGNAKMLEVWLPCSIVRCQPSSTIIVVVI